MSDIDAKNTLITGFHHIAIIASDYNRSKEFYTKVLDLDVIAETYRSERQSWKLDLQIPGGGQLELFSFPKPPKRVSRPEACGLRHLAFCVSDIEGEIARLTELGVDLEPIRVDELTGSRFTFFADPDDLPIELYETL